MDNQPVMIEPFHALIGFYANELFNECVINKDASDFWEKSNEHIFGSALVSFRTALADFIKSLGDDKDMYNYFAQLIIRAYAHPFTKKALAEFGVSFDEITKDKLFGNGFDYNFNDLSRAEQLLLFFSVHRDQITLALDRKKQDAQEALLSRRMSK